MEVSSHALVQGRVDGFVFDVAVFLNLGRDHLDFHHDLEDYFLAKAALFTPEHARHAVINVDDAHGRRLRRADPAARHDVLDRRATPADWRAVNIRPHRLGTDLEVLGPDGVDDRPVGAAAGRRSTSPTRSRSSPRWRRPGTTPPSWPPASPPAPACPAAWSGSRRASRSPRSSTTRTSPTPSTAVLSALRPVTAGRLIVVIGAGGDRDHGKRPLMGEAAARHADVVIVTDDNPRSGATRPRSAPRSWRAPRPGPASRSRSATAARPSPHAVAHGAPRRHRRGRRQGARARPGGRRRRASLRRPRGAGRADRRRTRDPADPGRDRRASPAATVVGDRDDRRRRLRRRSTPGASSPAACSWRSPASTSTVTTSRRRPSSAGAAACWRSRDTGVPGVVVADVTRRSACWPRPRARRARGRRRRRASPGSQRQDQRQGPARPRAGARRRDGRAERQRSTTSSACR